MAVLVTVFGVVLALLALLVAGLLRSHAEILRALHDLGLDMDPQRADHAAPARANGVRAQTVPRRATRVGADIAGSTPTDDAVSISVVGTRHLTLLAFLTSGCSTCVGFWDAFGDAGLAIPGGARLVVVTKSASDESVAGVRRLAPTTVPVVMSNAAWDAYDVPVAPFFVLVDGASGHVVGEGAANTWEQVTSLLGQAMDDAGLVDRHGRIRSRARPRPRGDALREARADRDLLAAGIRPGDPSLYAALEDPPGPEVGA
jgi:hypothetical protein